MKPQISILPRLISIVAGILLLAPAAWSVTPKQTQVLLGADRELNDAFGWSVAIDGDLAVIGVWSDDDNGTNSGAAFLFVRSGGVW